MGLKNYRQYYRELQIPNQITMQQNSPEAICKILIDAVKGEDLAYTVSDLYRDYREVIKTHWTTICVVPDVCRQEPNEVLDFATVVMAVATHFRDQGDPSLSDSLTANAKDRVVLALLLLLVLRDQPKVNFLITQKSRTLITELKRLPNQSNVQRRAIA